MPISRARKAFVAAVAAIVIPNAAFAQDAAPLTDEQTSERLGFIEVSLTTGRPAASLWAYGWIGAYSAATVVQWALAGSHWKDRKWDTSSGIPVRVKDRGFAEDMLVGGATTALGAFSYILDPFLPATACGKFRRLPDGTPEERRLKLYQAEDLLRRAAEREKRGRGLTNHLVCVAVNAAAGIVTSAAFHRPWTDGLVTFAVSEAVSLAWIFTQPRRAMRDWHNYQVKYMGKPGTLLAARAEGHWSCGLGPNGVRIVFSF